MAKLRELTPVRLLLKPVYRLYEWLLWKEISEGRMPRHVAIIPDGNRRWAAREGFEPWIGHRAGYEKVREVLRWLWELGVEKVTLFAMSKENCLRRPEEERRRLFELIEDGLKEVLCSKELHERRVRVNVIGRLELVPESLRSIAERVMQETRGYGPRTLTIALCYGGRDEIVEAAKRVAEATVRGEVSPESLDEEAFRRYLFTYEMEDPDLVIRTSGVERISNFLLWQCAYSELYFVDSFWPEFRRIDLYRAIRSFQKRRRNFGA